MISKLTRLIIIFIVCSVVIGLATGFRFSLPSSTAQAIGDLTVDWGVPEGNPIFVVSNMAPGQFQTHNVNVTNSASSNRDVGVRSIKTSETGGLSTVLNIVISRGATDLYGGSSPTGSKTLAQFFTDSAGPNGIFLSSLSSGATATYIFKVTFNSAAGNPFQDTQVIFDLKIGTTIPLPTECAGINLLPTPITGSARAETLNGTPGNDLIMGMGGADKINGNGGDDCIIGGGGADSLTGGDGNDVIFGGGGADSIKGGNDNDTIFGEDGADSIKGESGNDYLVGGSGADHLDGGDGSDTLLGGSASDSANGGDGIDSCEAEHRTNCESVP